MSLEANHTPGGCGIKAPRSHDDFHQLVQDLKCFLVLSPNMTFSDIDPNTIIKRMQNYKSRKSEWQRYSHREENLPFTRNLVDPGNENYNLVSRLRHWDNTPRSALKLKIPADSSLDTWQGKPDPRPRWVTLYHEGTTKVNLQRNKG